MLAAAHVTYADEVAPTKPLSIPPSKQPVASIVESAAAAPEEVTIGDLVELERRLEEINGKIEQQKLLMTKAQKALSRGWISEELAQVKKLSKKLKNDEKAKKEQERLENLKKSVKARMKDVLAQLEKERDAVVVQLNVSRMKLELKIEREREARRLEKRRLQKKERSKTQLDILFERKPSGEDLEKLATFIPEPVIDKQTAPAVPATPNAPVVKKIQLQNQLILVDEKEIRRYVRKQIRARLEQWLPRRATTEELQARNIIIDPEHRQRKRSQCVAVLEEFLSHQYMPHPMLDPASEQLLKDIEKALRRRLEGFLIPYEQIVFGEKIGEGAFGVVYEAWLRGRRVAVKQLKHIRLAGMKSFAREVLSLRRAKTSPHVLRCLGACLEPPAHFCIITEYCDGGSLYELLHVRRMRLSLIDALSIARDIAEGMKFLHHLQPPLLHRDLTSHNILFRSTLADHAGPIDALSSTVTYQCRISDFGVAIVKDKPGPQLFSPNGHPRWRAPEVTRREPYTKRADTYMYGGVLFELFTNQLPFSDVERDGEAAALSAAGNFPAVVPDSLPQEIRRLIERCWNPVPKKRPSFREICKILERFICTIVSETGEGEPGVAGVVPPMPPAIEQPSSDAVGSPSAGAVVDSEVSPCVASFESSFASTTSSIGEGYSSTLSLLQE